MIQFYTSNNFTMFQMFVVALYQGKIPFLKLTENPQCLFAAQNRSTKNMLRRLIIFNILFLSRSDIPLHNRRIPDIQERFTKHYNDVIMGAIASQITSLTIVYSTVYPDAFQRRHQSPASLAFVRGIHWGRPRWIPRSNGQWRGKCFHLMTSSWI